MDNKNIAGVVLAGGLSSRMGQNKAFLDYNGKPLLDHMIGILQHAGLNNIYVSGDFEGYHCIPDSTPHSGPACAIYDVLQRLDYYKDVLFVPVDMPFLNAEALRLLLKQETSAYFMDSPLPAIITRPFPDKPYKAVKDLLSAAKANALTLPQKLENCMRNTNTPEEWTKALRA